MSSGAEHYRQAELLIDVVNDGDTGDTMLKISELLAMAQVHATLALAAATVHGAIGNDLSSTHDIDTFVEHAQEWLAVIADPQAGA